MPGNEVERLRLLDELNIIDTLEERAYDDLTALAAMLCGTPISLVSLLTEDRQWFKSHFGLGARETPREFAFCAHAILESSPFVIPDSASDPRFHDNPLVTGPPHVKFYAGVPLELRDGLRVGTLCVIDHHARELTTPQVQGLEALARQVVSQLELRLKIRELTDLDRIKSEFVSMVSHELRTPLTSMIGSLALLRSGRLEPGATDPLVAVAHDNAKRLADIVDDILDLTKLESGHFRIEPVPMVLNTLLESAIEGMGPYLRITDVSVQADLAGTAGITLSADAGRLRQVIQNLLSNAAKFSPAGEAIGLRSHVDGERVVLEVWDRGSGIPAHLHGQVFQKFATLQGTGKLPGTGLGLAICLQLVELHRGQIWFESAEAEGSRFFVSLPLA